MMPLSAKYIERLRAHLRSALAAAEALAAGDASRHALFDELFAELDLAKNDAHSARFYERRESPHQHTEQRA